MDGREEQCLVLPVKTNQIKKGKRGNWMMMCRLAECEPNARGQTHRVQLSYLNEEDLQKSYDFGYHKRTAHMGRVYEHGRILENRIDRTNNGTDIRLDGIIVLSDIDKSLLTLNTQNNRRYLPNLVLRRLCEDGRIFCGSICINDIPNDYIETNPENGKKFIRTRLYKMEKVDTYFNTHELVAVRADGSENQIGLFKEFQKEGFQPTQIPPLPESFNNQQNNQRNAPDSIDGIRF